jgi:prophage regulatory protein
MLHIVQAMPVRSGASLEERIMAALNQTAFNKKSELRILRRKQVEARIGLSRSTIYDGVNAGTFPKPINLGPQSVGWIEAEIEQWLRDRIAASRNGTA